MPSPESLLGFRLGQDRTLADWNETVAYLRALDDASERVHVEEVGKTTEGRPFLLVTISSEANMARLEEIRRANLRLWDPRGLAEGEAERLIAAGPAVVALHHGIHSDEVAASQTALETAHWLASSDEPEAREIREGSVVLLLPSQNPDGMQRLTEWYRGTLGTPFEGKPPPFLLHRYAGHDDNRDAYRFALQETRLVTSHVHDRWRPQIVHDLHQMGEKGARIFLPPYLDPWEPNVDPALRAATAALGQRIAAELLAQGKTGVVTHAIFDAWSPARSYVTSHGGVRILSECAGTRLGSPLEVAFAELEARQGYDPRAASWNFPAVWPGGHWSLRDVMEHQLAATRALLAHAARERCFWLRTFLEVNRRAVARGTPAAFVFPAEQRDPLAAARLLEILVRGGIEVQRARAEFETAAGPFPAGAHVVLMRQPASAFAKTVLEVQSYPDLREYPGGPIRRPYDATAHTLPLLMGVEVRTIAERFEAALDPASGGFLAPGRVEGKGPLLALGHASGDLVALARLLRAGVPARWALEPFADRGRRFPAGTLLAPGSARGRLEVLARELGLVARAVGARPRALSLRMPRIGVYRSFVPATDEGWIRYVLEREVGLPFTALEDADLREGGLAARFDVLVLPDQRPKEIVEGHPPGTMPDEYAGGIGEAGVSALRAFVEEGGTLVALGQASNLPIEDFGLGVRNVLAHGPDWAPGPDDVDGPGAILRARVDETHRLAHGLANPVGLWFEQGPAFEGGGAVASYAEASPLLSGRLAHGEKLQGKAALVEARLGRGRVVLFGFRPLYRAQSWATYVPFLNALFLSVDRAPAGR